MSESIDHTEEPATARREPRPLKLRHVIGVAVVTALFMGPISAFASHQFPDVPNSNLFHDQIDWMSDTGITTGFPDGTFKPNGNVTRGQMSAFMFRLYNLQAGLTSVDGGTSGGEVGGPGNIDVWETVNGLSTSVTIPAGTTARIVSTFSADHYCTAGDNFGFLPLFTPNCEFRFMIDPAGAPPATQMSPGVYAVSNSDDAAETTDVLLDPQSSTIQGYTGNLAAGTYVVTVQMRANDADGNGDPADDSLVVTVSDHVLTTQAFLNDRLLLPS